MLVICIPKRLINRDLIENDTEIVILILTVSMFLQEYSIRKFHTELAMDGVRIYGHGRLSNTSKLPHASTSLPSKRGKISKYMLFNLVNLTSCVWNLNNKHKS